VTAFRTVFLRDSALWLGFIAVLTQLGTALYAPFSVELQGLVNAVAVATAGLLTAAFAAADRVPPAVLGFIQAAMALALALGLGMSPYLQSSIMAVLTAGFAAYARTQVVSRVPSPPPPGMIVVPPVPPEEDLGLHVPDPDPVTEQQYPVDEMLSGTAGSYVGQTIGRHARGGQLPMPPGDQPPGDEATTVQPTC
jgi:hypothetical protein